MQITTKLCEIGKPSRMGITFPLHVAESIVENFTSPMVGEMGFPEGLAVSLDRVSHEVTAVYIEDGALMAKIKILDTPMGHILTALVESDIEPKFAIAGSGTPVELGVRPDDFELSQIHGTLNNGS
jgi:hypothetical protein